MPQLDLLYAAEGLEPQIRLAISAIEVLDMNFTVVSGGGELGAVGGPRHRVHRRECPVRVDRQTPRAHHPSPAAALQQAAIDQRLKVPVPGIDVYQQIEVAVRVGLPRSDRSEHPMLRTPKLLDNSDPAAPATAKVLVTDRVVREAWLRRPHAQVDAIAARQLLALLTRASAVVLSENGRVRLEVGTG